ncbi:hypothetical protein ACFQ7O_29585 [Streptomyces sp. NPDC056485]|uniref:hypothetical protein n=1 Tax=Streptomyces sp. NPDC056485 TaxID=3345834 RepID=UPI00369A60A9
MAEARTWEPGRSRSSLPLGDGAANRALLPTFNLPLADRELPLGLVRIYHARVLAEDAEQVQQALAAGHAEGRTVTPRPADGEPYRFRLARPGDTTDLSALIPTPLQQAFGCQLTGLETPSAAHLTALSHLIQDRCNGIQSSSEGFMTSRPPSTHAFRLGWLTVRPGCRGAHTTADSRERPRQSHPIAGHCQAGSGGSNESTRPACSPTRSVQASLD